MVLTKTFSREAFARAIESWNWLDLKAKVPLLTSLFGDVILQDPMGYWFLDSMEGSLSKIAASRDELKSLLGTSDGQDKYLLAGLAFAAERRGLILKDGDIYDFTVPPALGGAVEVENITTRDFVVALNMSGQLHDQIRRLPPGTPIKGFTIKD